VEHWKDVQYFEWYRPSRDTEEKHVHMMIPDLKVTHLESSGRFTMSGFLRRKYTQGYWWHIVTARTHLSAWPLKILTLSILLVLSLINFISIPILAFCSVSWVVFRVYSRKGRTRFCISKFQTKVKKALALCVIIMLFILEDLCLELGKIHSILNKARGKENIDIR